MGQGGFNAGGQSAPSMLAVPRERKRGCRRLMEGEWMGGDAALFHVPGGGQEGTARRCTPEVDGGCLLWLEEGDDALGRNGPQG
jgi:hypothetical protein